MDTTHTPGRFGGRIVVVTGGASGIGRASAQRFGQEGATVVILDRDTAGAERVAAEISAAGGTAHVRELNLLDEAATERVAASLVQDFPEIYALVNCAGVVHIDGKQDSPFIEGGLAGWDVLVGVNLKGAANLVHGLLPAIIAGRGSVVNVSSEAAFRSRPNRWIYDVTKAGVLSLTRSLAASLAPYAVRVNSVAPGGTITEMHLNDYSDPEAARAELKAMKQPNLLGRMADPAEIAASIAFLSSEDASFVTGTTLAVDGGGHGSR
jgi:NAD(P)-dependent dehydrogenase (short-subunit alcohol dehydrogenase family)